MGALTLLLLSGGGHTGTNIMASLAPRRAGLRVVATSDTPDEPALYGFDAVYLAPPLAVDAAGFERQVLEILAREAVDLVVPCRDDDVQWLAGLRERRADLAPRLLCGARALAEVVNDKWLSAEFSRAHGLPFAASLPCIDDEAAAARLDAFIASHGLPLVAKPRHGVDSNGIHILETRAQALRAMRRHDYVLQEYLADRGALRDFHARVEQDGLPLSHTFAGVKRSMQAFIGPQGDLVHLVCTLNQVTRNNARSVSIDDDPEAARIGSECARVFAGAGWRGPLNVQCQPDAAGALRIHEYNARFTGATGARWHIGHDEIGVALRAFTGRVVEPAFPCGQPPRVALEGLWPRAADPRHVRTLAEQGRWSRTPT